jgi:hypothetical protein
VKADRAIVLLSTACVALGVWLPLRRGQFHPSPPAEPPYVMVDPIPARSAAPPAAFDTVLREVNFDHVELEEALKLVALRGGADLVADWRSLEACGFDRSTPVTVRLSRVTLGSALLAVLHQAQKGSNSAISCRIRPGPVVRVFAAEEALGEVRRTYDVRDLLLKLTDRRRARSAHRYSDYLPPGPEGEIASELMRLVSDHTVSERGPDVVGHMMIEYWSGRLIINQTLENHARVADLLDAFRQDGLPRSGQPFSGQ